MDVLNACLYKLMRMMGKERAQQLAMEETLRQTQARLNTTAGQKNPAPASNPMVLAKPKPFNGTCGTASKVFVGLIGLHAVTYPKCFPTNTSKVAFTVLFMKDYTATW
ncbi:uncharacterized protein VP01_6196g1 [Puccinia sorghi]|uniref:Uncharacterized protein n=1 Tax=Puccinia sorghi TaxID=27349 RepID=A0A0L6UGT3_9BASI|nr:uncharacterized protein VP01_6196g1 [Puccinia sorghi]